MGNVYLGWRFEPIIVEEELQQEREPEVPSYGVRQEMERDTAGHGAFRFNAEYYPTVCIN